MSEPAELEMDATGRGNPKPVSARYAGIQVSDYRSLFHTSPSVF